jgi:hypothetical protein
MAQGVMRKPKECFTNVTGSRDDKAVSNIPKAIRLVQARYTVVNSRKFGTPFVCGVA